jgi:putative membrane protein
LKKQRSLFDLIALVFKGMLMGAANKVPGVSGGIIAYVGGFYEEFIYSLKQFNGKAASLVFKGDFKNFFQHVNGGFLSLLILGMLISYFSVAQVLDYLITHYEIWVWSCFFGMILGSVHFIVKQFSRWYYASLYPSNRTQ